MSAPTVSTTSVEDYLKLKRLHYLLSFKWDCEVPGCDGMPGHQLPGTTINHPHRHARHNQLAPPGGWRVWMLMTGRGFGKTRAGAEWVKARALAEPGHRVAIIAPDFAVGRDVCIEGESGLRGLTENQGVIPWEYIKTWNRSTGEMVLKNGSMFKIFGTNSRADAESLRGYQAHSAWFEELGTQRYGDVAWDMLQFALRLGSDPRAVITTTPRRIPLIKRLLTTEPDVVITTGSTLDNAANLPKSTIDYLKKRYLGSTLGRQELMGEFIDDTPGALWSLDLIDDNRVKAEPDTAFERVVVGVDPAGSHRTTSDETGIIVVGMLAGHFFVLADYSGVYKPEEWAGKVVDAYHHHKADRVVAEKNFGGDMVESVLRSRDRNISFQEAHASRGKLIRAEPIFDLYERKLVHHVGTLGDLESQMTSWVPPGRFEIDEATGASVELESSNWSPDRLDALVWALHSLSQKPKRYIRSVVA